MAKRNTGRLELEMKRLIWPSSALVQAVFALIFEGIFPINSSSLYLIESTDLFTMVQFSRIFFAPSRHCKISYVTCFESCALPFVPLSK